MSAPRFTTFVRSLRVRLHPAQSVLCAVAFDGIEPGELTGKDRDIAADLFGDVEIIPPAARAVLIAVCGARGGKTYVLGALYSLWRALVADLSALAPGEQAVALIVAPDLRLARQCLRFALGAARSVPPIASLIESETGDGFVIRRPGGALVSIEALPATRGGSALRGRTLVSGVLDECAFFRDDSFVVNDSEIFRAVSPRVLPGGMIIVCSTPWAESGLLFDEFQRNYGHPVTAIGARATTEQLNPTKSVEVARERERDPENASREFDAQFMALGSGLFFDRTAIDRALELGAGVSLALGRPGTVGGDLALVRDASAFVSVVPEGEFFDLIDILELRPSKGAPLRLSQVVAQAAEFTRRHQTVEIHVDHHSLESAREWMPKGLHLTPVEGGQDPKVERFVTTRTILNEGRLRIPPSFRRLANQLREVISKPTSGGGLQITLPRRAGVHGDLVAAFVIAVHAASRDGRSRLHATVYTEGPSMAQRFQGFGHGTDDDRHIAPNMRALLASLPGNGDSFDGF